MTLSVSILLQYNRVLAALLDLMDLLSRALVIKKERNKQKSAKEVLTVILHG